MRRILVIKLGALGDFVQGFGPFAAIRAHHPTAHITLLTTRPFAGLAEASPWFDAVWHDGRPPWLDLRAVARLAGRLRAGRFERVYDLQTSPRPHATGYSWGARRNGRASSPRLRIPMPTHSAMPCTRWSASGTS